MDTSQVIDELAKRFGTTAEYLVKEMARYYIATDIAHIIIGSLLIVGSLIAVRIMFKKIKNDEWYEDSGKVWITTSCSIVGIIVGVVINIGSLVDCIGWIASPTAGAIHYIWK